MAYRRSALADKYLTGLKGIEIGGAAHNAFGLDTLNVDRFSGTDTIYKQDEIRYCGECMPVDIVAEGDKLPFPDSSWDFVISSHVLEHFYDPIGAIEEWHRVVKPGGYIFMIVPHKCRTFDHMRVRTTLSELIDRHNNPVDSYEDGHLSVWITEDVVEIINYLGYEIIEIQDMDDKVGNGFTVLVKVNK